MLFQPDNAARVRFTLSSSPSCVVAANAPSLSIAPMLLTVKRIVAQSVKQRDTPVLKPPALKISPSPTFSSRQRGWLVFNPVSTHSHVSVDGASEDQRNGVANFYDGKVTCQHRVVSFNVRFVSFSDKHFRKPGGIVIADVWSISSISTARVP